MKIAENADFTQWEMTAEEEARALQLSPETKAYIQNLKVAAASDLLNNLVNPAAGTSYDLARQAEIRGEIKAYSMLLTGNNPNTQANQTEGN